MAMVNTLQPMMCLSSVPHLGPAVDDINLMQGHDVHHFLPFLQLALRALHELCGWTHSIIIS